MPAKKKTVTKKKSVVRHSHQTSKRKLNFESQSKLTKVLLVLLLVLTLSVISIFMYDQMKTSDLKAKAARWTTITPLGADAGIRFVACKTPVGNNQYDVTIVGVKAKSLQLTKRDAVSKPLSTHPNFPNIYAGAQKRTNYTKNPAYGHYYETRIATPKPAGNRWWNNEVSALKLSQLNAAEPASSNDRLLVYGMSDQANAPAFRRSGSGAIIVTGGFKDVAPNPENYDNVNAYKAARAAWEAKAPTIGSLVNCQ